MKSKDPRYYLPPEHDPKPSVGIAENGFFYDPITGLFRRQVSRRGFLKGLAMGGVSVFGASGWSNTVSIVRPEVPEVEEPAASAAPVEVAPPLPKPVVKPKPSVQPRPAAAPPAAKLAPPVERKTTPPPQAKPVVAAQPAAQAAAQSPVREERKPPVPHNGPDFTFAVLADPHIMGPRNPLMKFRLETAIRQINELDPQPDFVLMAGDIITNGTKEEFDYFDAIMKELTVKVYYVPGEHDYFLDLGDEFFRRYGPVPFSFDHKGVHVIGLNSVLSKDFWTALKLTPEQRMKLGGTYSAGDKQGPFMLGREQLDWLERDLSKVSNKDTPLLVFTHIPLYHYYKPWNLWTEDAPDAHALLKPFSNVQVFHGHVHNLVENRIANVDFIGLLSTSWPHPYPPTYHELGLSGQMPRSNPCRKDRPSSSNNSAQTVSLGRSSSD